MPVQVLDPSPPSPEEDVHIKNLKRKCDEAKVVRPRELGANLSLPPVKHNKSKVKKKMEIVKKQPVKKINHSEEEYSPHKKLSIPKHEILPKTLRTRKNPGFSPQLQVINEISNNLSQESNLPSTEIPSEPVQELYHVDKDTITK